VIMILSLSLYRMGLFTVFLTLKCFASAQNETLKVEIKINSEFFSSNLCIVHSYYCLQEDRNSDTVSLSLW
jgi:hypothetical protein